MTQFLRSCVQVLVDPQVWIPRVIGLSAARSAMQAVSVEVTRELVAGGYCGDKKKSARNTEIVPNKNP